MCCLGIFKYQTQAHAPPTPRPIVPQLHFQCASSCCSMTIGHRSQKLNPECENGGQAKCLDKTLVSIGYQSIGFIISFPRSSPIVSVNRFSFPYIRRGNLQFYAFQDVSKPDASTAESMAENNTAVGSHLKMLVVLVMMMLLMLFAVHCTWVTSNAYSSPSIVLATTNYDGQVVLFCCK